MILRIHWRLPNKLRPQHSPELRLPSSRWPGGSGGGLYKAHDGHHGAAKEALRPKDHRLSFRSNGRPTFLRQRKSQKETQSRLTQVMIENCKVFREPCLTVVWMVWRWGGFPEPYTRTTGSTPQLRIQSTNSLGLPWNPQFEKKARDALANQERVALFRFNQSKD